MKRRRENNQSNGPADPADSNPATESDAVAPAKTLALLTLVSRFFGLARELSLAYFFGISEIVSAFRIAFMVPNLARRLFGEGALSAAMIPVLSETLHNEGEKPARQLVGSLVARLCAILIAIVVIAEIGLVPVRLLRDDPAFELVAWLLPYMVLICVAAVLGGVLNVRKHFATPAAMPIILNIAIIAGLFLAVDLLGMTGRNAFRVVSVAILIAGLLQVGALVAALKRARFTPLFREPKSGDALKKVLGMMGPMAIGISATQVNALADYLIAYTFIRVDGERVGPAVLAAAHFLYQLPLGVFGIAIATAVFPALAHRAATGDHRGLMNVFGKGFRLSFLIAAPSTVGLMFVAQPLVETLYEHGKFDSQGTDRVAGTLFVYSIGMIAYFANHLLARCHYAVQNSRTPARIAVGTVATNLALNLALVGPLEERGLALATASSAIFQAIALWIMLPQRKSMPGDPSRGGDSPFADAVGVKVLMKTTIATAIMAAALCGLHTIHFTRQILLSAPSFALVLQVLTGVTVFAIAVRLLGINPRKI